MKKDKSSRSVLKKQNIFQAILILVLITIFGILSSLLFHRFDLTKEKRFSITETSKNILDGLEDQIIIDVYLEGDDLPVELIRYKKTVKEFLDNLKSYSNKIDIIFKNPFDEGDPEQNREIYLQLYNKGLSPTYISQSQDMGRSEKMIFAGAIVKYGEKEYPINLINNNLSTGSNYVGLSEAELERDFMHAIWMITNNQVKKIAFLEGHKELTEYQTYDIMSSLSKYYHIDRVNMNHVLNALDDYDVVVVAKPEGYFTEKDKFILDQYIMQGGKIIWLIEWMKIEMDSLSTKPMQMAMLNDINLDDQLFNYGVRINPDLIQDLSCLNIPVYVNTVDGKPQFEPRPWPFFPVIIPDTLLNHSLLKNIEPIRTHFASSIDTVGENPKIRKTILLRTSKFSKSMIHPVEVNLEIMRGEPELKTFNKPNLPIAVLLEGKFKSNFVNRLSEEFAYNPDFKFIPESEETKMIIISDGDFIRNEVRVMGNKQQPYPLGADKYYPEQFTPGNTQFFVNCVNYLCADDDFISLRMREVKIRKLNKAELKNNKNKWLYLNTILPILFIIIIGGIILFFRKLRYNLNIIQIQKTYLKK
ncbi:MAG: gliding motility-associated ABC transporter substrate-binding protein GldG [Bacteroidales bacterium]|nr:gliding motility-associated ABC transporter substrate-binding protein GldG [Bacteroidales bacterium]MCK9498937.1 gliding motility-associated ABC transporter substrate-binding protein GldG [Bacteroidales bacterium]MDY0313456.1 gliding motility-associated ABC transporter substrate-binding protein GldG [Bacteroidales bacterium]NLB86130.1 gliding motility-associated ABC transporter substrate-binding protein GldG [Bacteroidales bacterium]